MIAKGTSYVKIDKLVNLFELLSEWTSIIIENDDYGDRVNLIWSMN